MGIYSRDNLASGLQNALEAALRRRDEYVKQDAARRDANVKAITDMMKVAGRAAEASSAQEDKLKELEEERAAIIKAQNDMADAAKRGDDAAHDMFGYRPNMAGYSDYMDTMSGRRVFGKPTNMHQYLLELSKPDTVPAKPDDRMENISAMSVMGYEPGSAIPSRMDIYPTMPDGTVGKPMQPDYAAIMRDLMYKRSKGVY